MINNKKILGIITARGGSKGVPGKNIKIVGGKPLIAWTIEAGNQSRYLDRLILSSDDSEIIELAKKYGCEVPFRRISELASDTTPSIEVVLDAIERCPGYDWIVLLQPTSPLRITDDIDSAIELCEREKAPACVSVCESGESPFWMYYLNDSKLVPVIDKPAVNRRQDLPDVYVLNGSIYIAKVEWLKKQRSFMSGDTIAYKMPLERSIDIDTLDDFELIESYLRKNINES